MFYPDNIDIELFNADNGAEKSAQKNYYWNIEEAVKEPNNRSGPGKWIISCFIPVKIQSRFHSSWKPFTGANVRRRTRLALLP